MVRLRSPQLVSVHTPVLLEALLYVLQPQQNQNFIDGTIGGGGMAEAVLKRSGPQGKLLGIDVDPEAIERAQAHLQQFKNRVTFVRDNFIKLKQIIHDYTFIPVHGIYLDVGVSSDQLENRERGFSFRYPEATLDMRMGGSGTGFSAQDLLAGTSAKDLTVLLQQYGEEPRAAALARAIVHERRKRRIATVSDVLTIVQSVYPNKRYRRNPATRLFQALRIAVNNELENLKNFLPQAFEILEKNGRLSVITFHSLEDRIVKNFFRERVREGRAAFITKKAVRPNPSELHANPRSRSAKLRCIKKINSNNKNKK